MRGFTKLMIGQPLALGTAQKGVGAVVVVIAELGAVVVAEVGLGQRAVQVRL